MAPVNVRNLDQIQEQEKGKGSRLGALLLTGLASAAIVTSSVVMAKRNGPAAVSSADPLADLVASAQRQAPAERLDGRDVTFPSVLSDRDKTTTALAAVKDERGRLITRDEEDKSAEAPPPALDRLPVVPLPVGTLLTATPVTTEPKDRLTALAAGATRGPEGATTSDGSSTLAPAGADGGYQLQVASFKDQNDADKLVEELRRRGHRSFRQASYVPERGLWHRVRIGPFKTRYEAQKYKTEFESNEKLAPFLVDPEKVKHAEQARAARTAAQGKKSGRRMDLAE